MAVATRDGVLIPREVTTVAVMLGTSSRTTDELVKVNMKSRVKIS